MHSVKVTSIMSPGVQRQAQARQSAQQLDAWKVVHACPRMSTADCRATGWIPTEGSTTARVGSQGQRWAANLAAAEQQGGRGWPLERSAATAWATCCGVAGVAVLSGYAACTARGSRWRGEF